MHNSGIKIAMSDDEIANFHLCRCMKDEHVFLLPLVYGKIGSLEVKKHDANYKLKGLHLLFFMDVSFSIIVFCNKGSFAAVHLDMPF